MDEYKSPNSNNKSNSSKKKKRKSKVNYHLLNSRGTTDLSVQSQPDVIAKIDKIEQLSVENLNKLEGKCNDFEIKLRCLADQRMTSTEESTNPHSVVQVKTDVLVENSIRPTSATSVNKETGDFLETMIPSDAETSTVSASSFINTADGSQKIIFQPGDKSTGLVAELNELFLALKEEVTACKKQVILEVSELKKLIDDYSSKTENLILKCDELEAFSRRRCLLIHGINESRNEVTDNLVIDFIRSHFDKHFSINLIDRSHRLGRYNPSATRPRPIIVALSSYRIKSHIYNSKKCLKGSGLLLTESLTPMRREMLMKAKQFLGPRSAWSVDGNIFVFANQTKIQIRDLNHLDSLLVSC